MQARLKNGLSCPRGPPPFAAQPSRCCCSSGPGQNGAVGQHAALPCAAPGYRGKRAAAVNPLALRCSCSSVAVPLHWRVACAVWVLDAAASVFAAMLDLSAAADGWCRAVRSATAECAQMNQRVTCCTSAWGTACSDHASQLITRHLCIGRGRLRLIAVWDFSAVVSAPSSWCWCCTAVQCNAMQRTAGFQAINLKSKQLLALNKREPGPPSGKYARDLAHNVLYSFRKPDSHKATTHSSFPTTQCTSVAAVRHRCALGSSNGTGLDRFHPKVPVAITGHVLTK